VFSRLAGYEDVNDAERLRRDPAMRWVAGDRAVQEAAASVSQMGRFETEWLSRPENLAAHADLPGRWIGCVHGRRPPWIAVLDMDSSESPTHGEQEGSAYNGHFGCDCYHPLFVFNQFGDLERYTLWPSNVHSADGWRAVLEPVVARYRGKVACLYFRADAAFAGPEVFLEVEEAGRAAAGEPSGDQTISRCMNQRSNSGLGFSFRGCRAGFPGHAGRLTNPATSMASPEPCPRERATTIE
jgi:Transposase DDE domain group 1